MSEPCASCGAGHAQRVCPHDARGTLGVEVRDLRDLLEESLRLRAQVTQLQEANTSLVNERRQTLRSRVREFHAVMGQDIVETPTEPREAVVRHRARLIAEEFVEVLEALFADDVTLRLNDVRREIGYIVDGAPVRVDLVKLADGLADLDYVVEGTRVSCGIDGEPVMAAVHAANMAKTPRNDATKKVTKPEGWQPPDIRAVLVAQGWKPPGESS